MPLVLSTLLLLLHIQFIVKCCLWNQPLKYNLQPMCLLWVILLKNCHTFQIISPIHFWECQVFSSRNHLLSPLLTCSKEASVAFSIITSTWAGISATQYTLEDRRSCSPASPASSGQDTPQETEHVFRRAAESWGAWRQTFRPPCHFRWSQCVRLHLRSPQISEQVPSSHAVKTHFTHRKRCKSELL